jgi:HEAT repeat protein/4-amino-4-deoxy-L-arabinose transferase-like glycosyltransferase
MRWTGESPAPALPQASGRLGLAARVAPALVVVGLAAAYFAILVSYGFELEDEGLMLAQAARTLRGAIPYLDFDTGYTPGVFYLNALTFRLFGESAIPVRWVLAAVNSASALLVFALARRRAGAALAAVAALGYVAFLPTFPGMFASFNIPYPAWYASFGWLLTQVALDRHLRTGSRPALLLAGLAAGLTFSFKPNAGALAVLACGLTLAIAAAGRTDREHRLARVLLVLGTLAILALPLFDLPERIGELVVSYGILSAGALVLVVGRLAWARGAVERRASLAGQIGMVAAGALATTLPWMAYFLARLGPWRFAHDVLLIGSGAETLYGVPYPLRIAFPDTWSLMASAGIVCSAAAAFAIRRGWLRPRWAAALALPLGLAVCWLFVHLATMPEGLPFSLTAQAYLVGFTLVPVLIVAGALTLLARLRAPAALEGDLIATVTFAACMYLELFPRIDSMHLIVALPSAVVLAAIAARRLARMWAEALELPLRVPTALLGAAAAALAGIMAVPIVRASLDTDRVHLRSERLPIRVEARRGYDVRALGDLLAFLEARLGPHEPVFGFPAMGLVSFAIGTPNPVPFEYYFPGRPDHRDEVTLERVLARSRPRFVVTLNRRFGYFFEAPTYYFVLRPYIRQHYRLAARFGRYDVLQRRSSRRAAPAVVREYAPVPSGRDAILAQLEDSDRELRRTAVEAMLAEAGDAAGVSRLAHAWARGGADRLRMLRAFGEWGDSRVLPFVLRAYLHPRDWRVAFESVNTLFLLSLRDVLAPYQLARRGRPFGAAAWRVIPLDQLRRRMNRSVRNRAAIGIFAAHVFDAARDVAAIRTLEQMLEHRRELALSVVGTWQRVALHEALASLGRPEHLCDLVVLLRRQAHEVQDIMPSNFIRIARRHPEEAARCLARGLGDAEPLAREMSAYLGGAIPLAGLAPALRDALRAEEPAVRHAAAWALGRVRDPLARDALGRLAADAGEEADVRATAREAVGRIGRAGG